MQHVTFTASSNRVCSYLSKVICIVGLVFFIAACGDKTAEEHYQESLAFTANGNNEAAIVALKNAVQMEPRMAKARFGLGKLYLALNSFDSASKELTFALDYGYAENEVIPLLAKALHRSNANVALAELEYQTSILTPEEQLEVGYRKTQSLMALNKQQETIRLINKLVSINANSTYKSMLESLKLAINEQNIEALGLVKSALEADPLNRDAIDLTARLYLLNDDPEKASKLYQDYIKVAPEDLEAKFSLANMLIQQEQPLKAEKYIDDLLAVNPSNAALNQLKAIVRAADSDFKSAKEFAEKAINSGRNDFGLRMVAGLASFQLSDNESAIRHFSVIAKNLPDNHPALRMLAASQLELDMSEDASQVLARVTDVSKDDLALFSRAGYELIKAGKTDAASNILAQTEKLTETADDLTQLGVLKLTLNNLDGILDLEGAVAKAPESAKAKETLGGAYLATNQYAKGLSFARNWQKEEPMNVEGYLLESEILQRQENYSQAAIAIAKASKANPTSPAVTLASIRLAIREDRYEDALTTTEEFLEEYPSDVTALASYFQIKLKLGDPAPAIEQIETEALKNLDDEPLVMLASRTMLATNKFAQALDLLSNIEPSRLTSRTYWEVKGTALIRTNQLSAALTHYNQWISLFPKQGSPVIGLLRVLDAQGNYPKAAATASEFLVKNDNLQVTLMQAYYLAMSQDAKKAKQVLNTVDTQTQNIPFVRGIKARIALLENRGAQAIDDARVSYEANVNPHNLLVYVQTLDSAGRTDDALNIIQQHVNKVPNDSRSRALLAERKIGKSPTAALAMYEEMIISLPNNPVILNNAAYLLMQQDKLPKALQYSSKAHGIASENVDFADTYAQVLMRQNNSAKAVEVYNSVMNTGVTDENVILNYIESLLVDKDSVGARRKIQEYNSKIKSKDGKARLLILQATYLN
jgi:putative PEP-CTERM system TPR-repeat lipoprotein